MILYRQIHPRANNRRLNSWYFPHKAQAWRRFVQVVVEGPTWPARFSFPWTSDSWKHLWHLHHREVSPKEAIASKTVTAECSGCWRQNVLDVCWRWFIVWAWAGDQLSPSLTGAPPPWGCISLKSNPNPLPVTHSLPWAESCSAKAGQDCMVREHGAWWERNNKHRGQIGTTSGYSSYSNMTTNGALAHFYIHHWHITLNWDFTVTFLKYSKAQIYLCYSLKAVLLGWFKHGSIGIFPLR